MGYLEEGREKILREEQELENARRINALLDQQIAELKKKKIALGDQENTLIKQKLEYYKYYFWAKREEFAMLTDIPPFEYLTGENIHPLHTHSQLNVVLIGQFISELFKKYEKKDVESFLYIYHNSYQTERTVVTGDARDDDETGWGQVDEYTPYIIIGSDKPKSFTNNINPQKSTKFRDSIIIPLTDDRYFTFEGDDAIVCPANSFVFNSGQYRQSSGTAYYSPYDTLISDYNMPSNELVFNHKGYEFIRDLIYNLAYYQLHHDIRRMSAEETQKVYSKIYKGIITPNSNS